MFRELAEDSFLDTYSLLQERLTDKHNNTLMYDRDDIAEIYLFFDLDAHSTQKNYIDKNIDSVQEMINVFGNQTEEGKLFI